MNEQTPSAETEQAIVEATEQPIVAPKEVAIVGVLASDTAPKTAHLFKPGQTGNPGGRRKRPDTQVLAMVAAQVPAQMIVDAMMELLENKSWRAREAGVKLYLSYMIGMPVQRSISASTKLDTFLDAVRDLSDDEFTQVIEATTNE